VRRGDLFRQGARGRLRPGTYALVAASLALITVALFALRAYLSLATVVLVYLLVVFPVIAATIGGRRQEVLNVRVRCPKIR
jgi:hypothetical protein